MREEVRFYGKIMSATVSRIADKWFVSIQVDVPFEFLNVARENQTESIIGTTGTIENTNSGLANKIVKAVGIDLGIKTMATLSYDNKIEKIDAPKPLKRLLSKLKRLQRKLSRQADKGKSIAWKIMLMLMGK